MRKRIGHIDRFQLQKAFCKFLVTWGWVLLAVFALTLCLNIEFGWILIPCDNFTKGNAVNNVILALSYSYIAAVFFRLIIDVLPYIRRKREITPILRSQFKFIEENLRLCKMVVLPLFSHNNEYSRDEFCNMFSTANLYEDYYVGNGISKNNRLKEYRSKIITDVHFLLAYREFLSDEQFGFLSEILKSEYIMNGIDPYPNIEGRERYDYRGNQPDVGACIYDLYEKIKVLNIDL